MKFFRPRDLAPFVVFFCCVEGASFLGEGLRKTLDETFPSIHSVSCEGLNPSPPPNLVSSLVSSAPDPLVHKDPLEKETVIQDALRTGETFSQALARLQLDYSIRESIIESLSRHINFRTCRPGERFTLAIDYAGQLLRCTYERNPFEIYTLKSADDESYQVSKEPVHLDKEVVKISGTIEDSLFDAFHRAGMSDRLVTAYARIFSSRIDFNREVRGGDRFSLVFERFSQEGSLLGYGRILAAKFEGASGEYEAYLHTVDGEDRYFDGSGKDLASSFLRSPLPVFRITSSFSNSRLHPILGVHRPHHGIDLAAPIGTPVMAAADGSVEYVGWQRGYGRIVILKHAGGYETYYAHLSRFGTGIKKGAHVKQGQVIGGVGASGLATGPHLDYRVKQNGTFVDPLKIEALPRTVLAGAARQKFLAETKQIAQLFMDDAPVRVVRVENITVKGYPKGWAG